MNSPSVVSGTENRSVEEIASLMATQGLARVFHGYSGTFSVWEVAVYRRQAAHSAAD